MGDETIDRDAEQMAGSSALAKAVKANLLRPSRGAAGPDLGEMARELPEGRTDLRSVACSSAYADQITKATIRYETWYEGLEPEERAKLIADTRAFVSDQYFSALATAVSGQQLALHDAAESYHKAAGGAWELSSQLGNILQALSDKVIIAGIAAALGTATAETGVGAVVGYGVSGLIVVQMLELVNRASTIINTAGTVILGLFGGAMAIAHQGGDLSGVPLPTAAYSAPGGPP